MNQYDSRLRSTCGIQAPVPVCCQYIAHDFMPMLYVKMTFMTQMVVVQAPEVVTTPFMRSKVAG